MQPEEPFMMLTNVLENSMRTSACIPVTTEDLLRKQTEILTLQLNQLHQTNAALTQELQEVKRNAAFREESVFQPLLFLFKKLENQIFEKQLEEFPVFTGAQNQDFAEWLEELESTFRRLSMPEDAWADAILGKIRGDAWEWMYRYFKEIDTSKYGEIRSLLIKTWFPRHKGVERFQALEQIRQREDESAISFLLRIEKAFRLCHRDFTDKQKIEYLLRSCKLEVDELIQIKPEKFTGCYEVAKEALISVDDKKELLKVLGCREEETTPPPPPVMVENSHIDCWNCGGLGHRWKDCPTPLRGENQKRGHHEIKGGIRKRNFKKRQKYRDRKARKKFEVVINEDSDEE